MVASMSHKQQMVTKRDPKRRTILIQSHATQKAVGNIIMVASMSHKQHRLTKRDSKNGQYLFRHMRRKKLLGISAELPDKDR